VSSARNREIRKKLKIIACYLRKRAVTQGGGACPEPVEGPTQKKAIGSALWALRLAA